MRGEVSASSRNGVIRKVNLLSKILGVLNVYDLFRGKVNLLQKGLPYTKAGLTLKGENGIFKTDDFLIDSPSIYVDTFGKRPIDILKNIFMLPRGVFER
jgi:uncharacterized protein YhdP